MPARSKRYRALKPDFCLYIEQRGAWPDMKDFTSIWKNKGGWNKQSVTSMRRGGAVPEKYVQAVAELFLGTAVLADYLTSKGTALADQQGLTLGQAVECVAGPSKEFAGPGENEIDWHLQGIETISKVFHNYIHGTLERPGTFCEKESDVSDAISMIMITVGHLIDGGSVPLEPGKAIVLAEQFMKISYNDYLGRAIELWRVAPWSLAFAVVDRQRVGCCCVLPLTDSVYENVRKGCLNTHTLEPSDLTLPSRSLFLEAVGYKPTTLYPSVGRRTAQVIRTCVLQYAFLSLSKTAPRSRESNPVRVLSIAGNQVMATRLKKYGFRPTGTHIPGFEVPFMEQDKEKTWWVQSIIDHMHYRMLNENEGERSDT